jgi:hypothetical protein
MKLFNSKKKVVLSAVAVLLISVSAFAGSGTPSGDEEAILGKFFGTSCSVTGYQETCCKHAFWISYGCETHPDGPR